MLDELEQPLVGPVEILEDEHERLRVGELLRPAERRPGDLLAAAVSFLGDAEHAERDGEQVGDRVALTRKAELLECLDSRVVVGDARPTP